MIKQETVQTIIETAKVEEVINDFVDLKRRGVNMMGLCPFHNEKTPSFTVSPVKNIYKCFGCGKAGNAVQFLMDHEQLSFPDSLRYLAQKYNIKIEEESEDDISIDARLKKDSFFIINEFAGNYFANNLMNSDEGKSIGLSYFKERGYLEHTIKKFGLGYAFNRRDDFTKLAVDSKYNIELLRTLGLTTASDADFFRDRVIFPIHNISGKIIAFAGRILTNKKNSPKYLNSPESEIYNKRNILYGIHFAKQAIRKQQECILVEGYTDVISLHQVGIENVVASSGTSLTDGQINLIKRYSNNVKVLFDGDTAGIKAALRGVELILAQDLNVRIVALPDGEDPDSYSKKLGSTKFAEYLEKQSHDFILFKTNLLLEEVQHDPIRKSKLTREIMETIAKIPDAIKRSNYIKECSVLLGIQEEIIYRETNKILKFNLKNARKASTTTDFHTQTIPDSVLTSDASKRPIYSDDFQEKDLVRILLSLGHKIYDADNQMTVSKYLIDNLIDVLPTFENELYKRIITETRVLLEKEDIFDFKYFTNHSDEEVRLLSINLLSDPYTYANWEERGIILHNQKLPEENFKNDSHQALLRLKERKLFKTKEEIKKLLLEIQDTDSPEYYHLIKSYQKVKEMLAPIQKSLGTVIAMK